MTENIPDSLLLQWHITERCNLRCQHCYQDNYRGHELPFADWLDILAQFKELRDAISRRAGKSLRAHVTVTGGEPFAHTACMDLLQQLAARRDWLTFAVLSNGSLIDAELARRLKIMEPRFIQLSLDGGEQTHDAIRGAGNFQKTTRALQHLRRHGVPSMISFTAHRGNYREFGAVAKLGQKHGVSRVWADRLIPHGSGGELREQMLTPAETREFVANMAQAKHDRSWFSDTNIACNRALQFLGGGPVYHCTAGHSLITIQPDGEVYPCRRMPISVGNVRKTPLLEIYDLHPLLRSLRNPASISRGCENCSYQKRCRGGLKCLSYAVHGDPFQADPGCWLAGSGQ